MGTSIIALNVSAYACDEPTHTYEHSHDDCYQIFFCTKGIVGVKVDGKIYRLEKGCFVLIHPGRAHCIQAGVSKKDSYTVDMKFRVDSKWMDEKLDATDVYQSKSTAIEQLMNMIVEEAEKKRVLFNSLISVYIEAILYHVLRKDSHAKETRISDILNINYENLGECTWTTITFIENNTVSTHHAATLDQIASNVGYSRSYMCKCFMDEIGVSVSEFRRILQIDKAKELLQYTGYSVKEISKMLHYKSESYFNRFFKQRTGMTPLQYRKSNEYDENHLQYSFHNFQKKSNLQKQNEKH